MNQRHSAGMDRNEHAVPVPSLELHTQHLPPVQFERLQHLASEHEIQIKYSSAYMTLDGLRQMESRYKSVRILLFRDSEMLDSKELMADLENVVRRRKTITQAIEFATDSPAADIFCPE